MRIALVTGAAQGIGERIAERFEESGFFVYRADISAGTNLQMDVTDRGAVQAAFKKIIAEKKVWTSW